MEELIDLTEKRIKQLGIKKSHVAKMIGCTPMEFSHFLKDRRNLKAESVTMLKNYLKIV